MYVCTIVLSLHNYPNQIQLEKCSLNSNKKNTHKLKTESHCQNESTFSWAVFLSTFVLCPCHSHQHFWCPCLSLLPFILPILTLLFEIYFSWLSGCQFSFALIVLWLFSCSSMSDSLQPHGLQLARLPCPPPSPGACSNSRPLS